MSFVRGENDVGIGGADFSKTLTEQINRERLRKIASQNPHYLEIRKVLFDTLVNNLESRFLEFDISKDQLVQYFTSPEYTSSHIELERVTKNILDVQDDIKEYVPDQLFWTFSSDSKWKETIFLLWKVDKCITSLHCRTSDKEAWTSSKTTTGWLSDSKEVNVFYGNILNAPSTQFKLRISPYKLQQCHPDGMISMKITNSVLWCEEKASLFMNIPLSIPNSYDDDLFWFKSDPNAGESPYSKVRPLWYEDEQGVTDQTSDIILVKHHFPKERHAPLAPILEESSKSNIPSNTLSRQSNSIPETSVVAPLATVPSTVDVSTSTTAPAAPAATTPATVNA